MEVSGADQNHRRPSRGLRVVAVLVGLISILLLFSRVTSDGFTDSWAASYRSDSVLAILTLATVFAGAVVASGLWSARRWVFAAYVVWALLYVVVFVVSDSRVEPVGWKVAAGAVPPLILTVVGAFYVRRGLT